MNDVYTRHKHEKKETFDARVNSIRKWSDVSADPNDNQMRKILQ